MSLLATWNECRGIADETGQARFVLFRGSFLRKLYNVSSTWRFTCCTLQGYLGRFKMLTPGQAMLHTYFKKPILIANPMVKLAPDCQNYAALKSVRLRLGHQRMWHQTAGAILPHSREGLVGVGLGQV